MNQPFLAAFAEWNGRICLPGRCVGQGWSQVWNDDARVGNQAGGVTTPRWTRSAFWDDSDHHCGL